MMRSKTCSLHFVNTMERSIQCTVRMGRGTMLIGRLRLVVLMCREGGSVCFFCVVCVCVCVRAYVRVYVRACVHVCRMF